VNSVYVKGGEIFRNFQKFFNGLRDGKVSEDYNKNTLILQIDGFLRYF